MWYNLEFCTTNSEELKANAARSVCQLLLIFNKNNFLDKPDYCHVLLDVLGIKSLFSDNIHLHVLSRVSSLHDFQKLLMKIKLGAIKEKISEQQYMVNNMGALLAQTASVDLRNDTILRSFEIGGDLFNASVPMLSKRSRVSDLPLDGVEQNNSYKIDQEQGFSNVNAMNAFGVFVTSDVTIPDNCQGDSDLSSFCTNML